MAAETMSKEQGDIYSIIESQPWKGRVLFTGPDMIGDHRVTVTPEHRQIGIGIMSPEGTSETDYLWRAAPRTPFPRPRTSNVGEVGWGVPYMSDTRPPTSGQQIVLGEFRQHCEDGHTHRYQNPWYPGPIEDIRPNTDAADVMNVYRPRTSAPKSGSSRSRVHNRRFRRTPSATQTTNYYQHQSKYDFLKLDYSGNQANGGLDSDGNTSNEQSA